MKSRTSRRLLGVLVLMAVPACVDEDLSSLPTTTEINIVDNSFDPVGNRIGPGATVTWTWSGGNQHNVTFDDTLRTSSATQTQGTFTQTFASDGEYTYYCTVHGRDIMSGRVVVGSAVGSTPTGGGY